VAVRCDHTNDGQVATMFEQIARDQDHLDLLVNNVFGGPYDARSTQPFWERPLSDWEQAIDLGLRAHYVASIRAAQLIVPRGSGLIVNISSFGSRNPMFSVAYGVSKAGADKMVRHMGAQLEGSGIAAVSLWLGPVRTERILALKVDVIEGFDIDTCESPEFPGRIIASIIEAGDYVQYNGQVLIAAEVAVARGIVEFGGAIPVSLRELLGGPEFS